MWIVEYRCHAPPEPWRWYQYNVYQTAELATWVGQILAGHVQAVRLRFKP